MNIALIGYGSMNQAIEKYAIQNGHTILHRITTTDDLLSTDLSQVDCAMEFSHPNGAVQNMLILIENGVNTVAGTTGCQDEMGRIQQTADNAKAGFLWSPNFSIGVHLFWRVIENATCLFDSARSYDVFGHEWHHARKSDSPSGTARRTADIILDASRQKDTLVTERFDRAPRSNELHFSSTRGGSIPGTHSVFFDSPFDTIEVTHRARTNEGFARGAMLVGEWLQGKRGWFTMQNFIEDFQNIS